MSIRTLVIQQHNDIREPESLHTVYIFTLPDDTPGNLRGRVFDELMKHGYGDGYTLERTEGVFEWGGSNDWEEVLLRISDAMMSGAVEAIIGGLLGYAIAARQKAEEKLKRALKRDKVETPDYEPDWSIQLNHYLNSFKRNISDHFKVSVKALELVEYEQNKDIVIALFRDNFGDRYQARTTVDGYTRLEKLANSTSSPNSP